MSRLLAFDYGHKRIGLAVSDPLQLIATPLQTILAKEVMPWVKHYLGHYQVTAMVVGMPRHLDGKVSLMTAATQRFISRLQYHFPKMPLYAEDERLTSVMAAASVQAIGLPLKARREKGRLDRISATLILQSFMERYKAGHAVVLPSPARP